MKYAKWVFTAILVCLFSVCVVYVSYSIGDTNGFLRGHKEAREHYIDAKSKTFVYHSGRSPKKLTFTSPWNYRGFVESVSDDGTHVLVNLRSVFAIKKVDDADSFSYAIPSASYWRNYRFKAGDRVKWGHASEYQFPDIEEGW